MGNKMQIQSGKKIQYCSELQNSKPGASLRTSFTMVPMMDYSDLTEHTPIFRSEKTKPSKIEKLGDTQHKEADIAHAHLWQRL